MLYERVIYNFYLGIVGTANYGYEMLLILKRNLYPVLK